MDNEVLRNQLIILIRESLSQADNSVPGAADYLSTKKKPFFLSKNRAEKLIALDRVQKIFNSSRDRPLWFVLKCMDLKPEDLT